MAGGSQLLETGAMVDERRRAPKGGRSQAMQSAPQIDPSLAPLVAQIFQQYPALARHKNDFAVMRGRPMLDNNGKPLLRMPDGRPDDRQLESYAPDESWSPMPGKAMTELYNSAVPPAEQQAMIAGDFLHHLPDVDPTWAAMKADVVPQELQADPQLYRSRADEWLMGYLTPDAADEWRKGGAYSPEQAKKLDRMKAYLTGSPLLPTGRP